MDNILMNQLRDIDIVSEGVSHAIRRQLEEVVAFGVVIGSVESPHLPTHPKQHIPSGRQEVAGPRSR